MTTKTAATPFWTWPLPELLQQLDTSSEGLSSEEAHRRLIQFGGNHLRRKSRLREAVLFMSQFKNPIVLILLSAAALSVFLGNSTDAVIILTIVLVSGLLGYWQEHGAGHAVERLLTIVRVTAEVVRDGTVQEIATDEIVPGDILLLSAGAGVPGDCRVLESKNLFADEATLTGETYPIEKIVGVVGVDTPLNQRTNCVWMGTHVISGKCPGDRRSDGKKNRIRSHRATLNAAPAGDRIRAGRTPLWILAPRSHAGVGHGHFRH